MSTIKINSIGTAVTINKTGKPVVINPPIDVSMGMLSFNGTSDYLTIPQTTLNFTNTDPQSYEVWFKLPTVGDVKRLFSMYDSATTKGTMIFIDANKYIVFYIRNAAQHLQLRTQAGSSSYRSQILIPERWYQLIVTYDGTDAAGVVMYVDGFPVTVLTVTNSLASSPENMANVVIGATPDFADYSDQTIGVVRVFSKALSESEVKVLYNVGTPLLETEISDCVFEILPDNPLTDSANDVAGTNNGATLAESDVNLNIRNGNQLLVSSKVDYNTYGLAGDDRTLITNSPFTDKRTNIIFDSVTNRTYIAWQQRAYLGGNRQSMLMYVDHAGGFATPSYPLGYVSPGTFDTHPAPACIITPDNEILVIHEDMHASPIYCKKTTGKNPAATTHASTITGEHAYPAICKVGSNLFVITRGGTQAGGAGMMEDYITKSTDNGATWGTSNKILDLDNGTGTDRAYFLQVYHPTKLCYFIKLREDSVGLFTTNFYIESTDGETFSNVGGTFSKDITSAALTRAELEANCLVNFDSGEDVMLKECIYLSTGPAGFINHPTDNYQYFYWSGSVWVFKTLNLAIFTPVQSDGNEGKSDYWACYAYDDNHQILWRIETRSTFDVVVQYETLDAWDSWDAGTIVSGADIDHQQLQGTQNKDATKIIIAANILTDENENNNMFIYEYTPTLD